ncbi:polyphenol oxidase family protein [Acidaminobacter hydrogenoformans]|uniref:Purine nucleoside phosphorylase n=1 Tax=Acidaminobacter hydrogenoformans DSM 2784 TaxID=1120920 RepID=A0A1G5RT42_9FIRM|nr:polyphenol oxidase family protein [Acidaminobacter hydrogenoformans]SCZ77008.1 conserved hypothetical protein [Acidaminobacter hydrogenoformans DSM 2784]
MSNLEFKSLDKFPELVAGMTTRHGGVSTGIFESNNMGIFASDPDDKAIVNMRAFIKALPVRLWKIAATRQVHGTHYAVLGTEPPESIFEPGFSVFPETDILMTNQPGVLLITFYGDCVPILVYDPEHHAVGLCHSGWKGTSLRAAAALVEGMTKEYGSRPAALHAVVMPAAGVCCYEVGFDVSSLFQAYSEQLVPFGGKHKIDLKGINAEILKSCGVPEEAIEISPLCTMCDDRFFSNRRDGGHTGRMAAFACLKSVGEVRA